MLADFLLDKGRTSKRLVTCVFQLCCRAFRDDFRGCCSYTFFWEGAGAATREKRRRILEEGMLMTLVLHP